MKSAITKIILLIISLWFVLSIFNIAYNSVKSYFEIKEWGYLSEFDKRRKIYGELQNFLKFVDNNTKENSNILIISNDNLAFYYSRYYLYPKHVNTIGSQEKLMPELNYQQYDYIAAQDELMQQDKYVPVATYSGAAGFSNGILYKIK